MKKILPALFLLALGVSADAAAPSVRAGASAASGVADASNRFCVDLYGRLQGEPGNLAFSPYSISSALAMTYAGARGRTEEEMAHLLHLPLGQDSTHAAFGALRGSLQQLSSAPGCTLSVANRLWGQEGTRFLAPFLGMTRDAYGAEIQRLDFERKSEQSRQTINDWTSDQTRGRIADLLPPGSVNDLTRLVLTNAIYFKSNWKAPFKESATFDQPFYPDLAETLRVKTMHQTGPSDYAHEDGVQILVMKYACAGSSMVILLPDAINGLGELEAGMTAGKIEAWIGAANETEVAVSLPKFRVASSFSLRDALAAMGMPSAFSLADADFSGMTGERDLFVSAVVHKTVVDVAEKGTEAAAATAVAMCTLGLEPVPPVRPIPFTADHPFLFLIREQKTGCILFIGRVTKPEI